MSVPKFSGFVIFWFPKIAPEVIGGLVGIDEGIGLGAGVVLFGLLGFEYTPTLVRESAKSVSLVGITPVEDSPGLGIVIALPLLF